MPAALFFLLLTGLSLVRLQTSAFGKKLPSVPKTASRAENETLPWGECSYQKVLDYLNLTKHKELFTMSRPVKDHNYATKVTPHLVLHAILDVKEIDHTFVPYVWIDMTWDNEFISWEMEDFCNIDRVMVPSEVLWKPDITITEVIENERMPTATYLTVTSFGQVKIKSDQVLVSSCKMQVYKFPFDVQSCTLTFKSVVHSASEVELVLPEYPDMGEELSRHLMKTQYEWLFLKMDVNQTMNDLTQRNEIVYTIHMRRKPVLYIINFLVPILFFFSMDLASFLISDSGGEKLSFKITVMLAVTVMQLILNDILPSSSTRIPLIALYCIGIFGLMMLSLLETIVVMYLLQKDEETPPEGETDGRQKDDCEKLNLADSQGYKAVLRRWTRRGRISSAPPEETFAKHAEVGCELRESAGSEKTADELVKELKILTQLLGGREEEKKPGYWSEMTKTINKVFLIFYVMASSLFLWLMYYLWHNT